MKTILLIEDNADLRENTAELLEESNYKIITAENGKIGIELAINHLPDLIICDIMMPELDGYEVLEILSKNPLTETIPFVFLTARSENSDLRKGMSLGADDYITKPFKEVELIEAIETRLRKNEMLKTVYQQSAEGIESFIENAQQLLELNGLSKNRTMHLFKKKYSIYNEGSFPRGIYFIQKGKVKTFISNEDGKDYIIGLYNEGEFFGYLSLLEETVYRETSETLEDSEIYFIPKEDFFTLLVSNREVAKRFIKMLSSNLVEMETRILKLAYNSVRKRVAESLVMLEKTYNNLNQQPFTISMSREDIANIVGTSTETVIRALSDFKDENIIAIKGRNISIINLEKLQKMKN
jgi:CRP/FNR family transcriptional regulator, polysaccharide utilization system transcription regulator